MKDHNRNKEIIMMKLTQIIGPMFKAAFKFQQEISTILTDNTLDTIDARSKIDEAKDDLVTSIIMLLITVVDDNDSKSDIVYGAKLLRPHIDQMLEIEVECIRGTVFKALGQVETGSKVYNYACKKTINFAEEMLDAVINISDKVQDHRNFRNSCVANDAENGLSKEIIDAVKAMEGTKGVGVGRDKVVNVINKIMDERNKNFRKVVKENTIQ